MNHKCNIHRPQKPYSVGIIGGGQLALMLVEAANKRGIKVCVQTNSTNDPAGQKADFIIEADPLQIKGNRNLIKECEKIIFENEWIKIEKLRSLGSDSFFVPGLNAISPLVNRISQKEFIDKLNLPSPKWISLRDYEKLNNEQLLEWEFPLMAKKYKGGYDGKGNKKIINNNELTLFISKNNSEDWLLEEWICYENELALVGSRDNEGKIRVFPIVETFQSNNICDWVLSPAQTNYELNIFALNIFSSIVNELNYVGVLGIEFFFGEMGLLINEIAPRTHNSAHFSIEACNSSQFDQHICISSGLTPPEIKMHCKGSIMLNLLGLKKNFPVSVDERLKKLSEFEEGYLHWYGKTKEKLGRKMGHITFLMNEENYEDRYNKSQKILKEVREIWPSPH